MHEFKVKFVVEGTHSGKEQFRTEIQLNPKNTTRLLLLFNKEILKITEEAYKIVKKIKDKK